MRRLACVLTLAAGIALVPALGEAPPPVLLTVEKAGSGTGRVISEPPDASIDCGDRCVASVGSLTFTPRPVTLLAIPGPTSVFAGWSVPGCDNPCTVQISGTVTATFVDQRALPDLVVTALTTSAAPPGGSVRVPRGGALDVTVTVKNQGVVPAGPFRLGFYWGFVNLDLSFFDRYDRRYRSAVSCEFAAGLAAGADSTCAATVDVPSALDPFANFLFAFVDESGEVDESNEGNNARRLDDVFVILETPALRPAVFFIAGSGGGELSAGWGVRRDLPVPADYDGDGRADVAVWRPGGEPGVDNYFDAQGNWYILRSSDGASIIQQWGQSTDVPVPADYDGDGRADIAVWRGGPFDSPDSGTWYIVRSSDGGVVARQWGARGDVPVPADYDGDGRADIAVWRPGDPASSEQGIWFILRSSDGAVVTRQWGSSSLADVPVPGDYDGDGRADIAVWRPSTGTWFIVLSSTGAELAEGFGAPGDIPMPRDWDGDGVTDLAVWRPSTGAWFIRRSTDGAVIVVGFGAPGDLPIPADYDGDGRADVAVFRP